MNKAIKILYINGKTSKNISEIIPETKYSTNPPP